jgi:hypothetical protein|tara:strand:+ start:24652 stop:25038 length:387 start_codon:yes stop_codon:yes gene_type:complete
MSNRNITFDEQSGVPYAANLTIFGGADFSNVFTVKDPNGSLINFTGYDASSQMTKSVSIGSSGFPAATFTAGISSALGGKIKISLGSTETRTLAEGRYVYNVLVSSGSTIYSIVNGNITVQPGISSAP